MCMCLVDLIHVCVYQTGVGVCVCVRTERAFDSCCEPSHCRQRG